MGIIKLALLGATGLGVYKMIKQQRANSTDGASSLSLPGTPPKGVANEPYLRQVEHPDGSLSPTDIPPTY
jgi:hypothetical protein